MIWDDWKSITPIITPELAAAVDKAYEVFAVYRLTDTIVHCDCELCMDRETARELTQTGLKEISRSLLSEYTNSAHPGAESEFKHFLPRYLDLIAQCDPPCAYGLETTLHRARGYRDRWPGEEVEVIDAFFDAFIAASLGQVEVWGNRLRFDMGEALGLVICSDGDLSRALAVIDNGPDPEVALHLASMRLDIREVKGHPNYSNEFYSDRVDVSREIGEWLVREIVTDRIVAARSGACDSSYHEILERGADTYYLLAKNSDN